jgi:hypothetical protein
LLGFGFKIFGRIRLGCFDLKALTVFPGLFDSLIQEMVWPEVGTAMRGVKSSEILHEHVTTDRVALRLTRPTEIVGSLVPRLILTETVMVIRRHQMLTKLIVVYVVIDVMRNKKLLLGIWRSILRLLI